MYSTILVGLALTVGAPAAKEPPKKESPTIVGEWTGEKATAGGKDKPVPPGGVIFVFTADGMLMVKEGGRVDAKAGGFTHDPKKTPAEIDLVEPGGKGSILGIYKIEGDTLPLCILGGNVAGGAPGRPSKFESPEGSQTMLMTFKRVKK